MHSLLGVHFSINLIKITYIYFVISEKSTTFAPALNIFSFYFEHFYNIDWTFYSQTLNIYDYQTAVIRS